MEDPTIPELLLEVTTIEDLVDVSRRKGAKANNLNNLNNLKTTARGFRNLVAHPQDYGVDYGDYRRWITTFETKFNEAEKNSRADPDLEIVDALANVLTLSEVHDNVELSEKVKETFGLRDKQKEAFQSASNQLPH